MGKFPKELKEALSTTLHDYEIRSIECDDLDQHLWHLEQWSEEAIGNGKADEHDLHILNLSRRLRELLEIGEINAAIEVAIILGEVLTWQEIQSVWDRGRRSMEAGQKSAAATWGLPDQRRARIDERRSLFERERPKFNSDQEAFESVAKQCGVSWRTIRRTVTGN
jgi:hypothetical protein